MFLAYIDPGTAGQVLGQGGSFILVILGTVLGVIGLFFRRILAFIKGIFGKK